MKLENPTDCPYYLISRLTLVMTSMLKKCFKAAGVGKIKPSYLGVLWSLWNEEGIKVSELGRRAGLEPSTMTGLLDRMERDGLVVRVSVPNDRRAHHIQLTEGGREVKDIVVRLVQDTMDQVFVGVPQDELEKTTDVLKQVLKDIVS